MIRKTQHLIRGDVGPSVDVSPRVLLAKVGLDGHDRGIKVIARGLRDHGFHVIYGGIWQDPASIAQAAIDEDADWLGLSLLSGAHMTLVPRVLEEIKESGNRRTRCVVGGIIPESDVAALRKLGVEAVFGPGTPIAEITEFLQSSPSTEDDDAALLAGAIRKGDRIALARFLTLISRGCIGSSDIPVPRQHRISTIAITGSAGVGKSSLIAELTTRLVQLDLRIAVLACDPQSSISGGSLLGDRVRMSGECMSDPRLLVRSLPVAAGGQGIARHLDRMVLALQLFGFDLVIIESAGVGQGDIAVHQVADRLILLLQPESGDGIQWEKAGLLEFADMLVINKSDLPGADRVESELNEHLKLPGAGDTAILRVSANKGEGIDQLCQLIWA